MSSKTGVSIFSRSRTKDGRQTARETKSVDVNPKSHVATIAKVPVLKIVLKVKREKRAENFAMQEAGPRSMLQKKVRIPMRQMKRRPVTPELMLLVE